MIDVGNYHTYAGSPTWEFFSYRKTGAPAIPSHPINHPPASDGDLAMLRLVLGIFALVPLGLAAWLVIGPVAASRPPGAACLAAWDYAFWAGEALDDTALPGRDTGWAD